MAFVVSEGQITKLQTGPALMSSWSNIPATIQVGRNQWLTYSELWRSQPAVRTVIGFVARNIAHLGIDVFTKNGPGGSDRRKATDHPLTRLLNDPLPGSKWNRYRLINWTVHELCIYDAAHWLKVRGDDGQLALMPIPRRFIDPVGTNALFADKYRITGQAGYQDVDADQVVHFHGYSDDPRFGVSPIETLRQVLAEEYAAGQYREQMWRNGARTGGVIERPRDAPKWSDKARVRFETEWRAMYSGDGSDAGGTAVLEDGMTYKPTGITPKEAQFVESRKLTREEVAIAYYLNPVMLGISEGTTAGGWKEMHTQLYQDGLGPWLEQLSQDIQTQLLLDMDPTASDGSTYVEFNIQEKMRGSFEEQAAAISASVGGPWMTRTEARTRFNLAHLPEADELVVPMNVTAGGLASPRDTAPDHPSNAESNGQLPGPKPPQGGSQ